MYNYNTTDKKESQEQRHKILKKCLSKKRQNESIIKWLIKENQQRTAENITHCAEYIGMTEINGITRVVKADFCRERICSVCAWRRQAKFVAQMSPILAELERDYKFLFLTLTIKNCNLQDLKQTIDIMLKGYDRLLKRRKVKKAFKGCIRSLEITHNKKDDTLHPHLHILVAVKQEYFTDTELYIPHSEIKQIWGEVIGAEYDPFCFIEAVKDDEIGKAKIETLKYALKPTIEPTALSAFYYILKGRRTISFSGIFAAKRREYKLSDFENILTDENEIANKKINYTLYKLDCTGGIYSYVQEKEYELK